MTVPFTPSAGSLQTAIILAALVSVPWHCMLLLYRRQDLSNRIHPRERFIS